MLGTRRGGMLGLDARLRLICVLSFAVGIAVLLVVTNTALSFDQDIREEDRVAIDLISGFAAVIVLGILAFPWQHYGRNAFAVVPALATVFIALVIAFSGGFDSFGYRFFILVAVFYGLCFSRRVIVAGMAGIAVAGASPMLYEPNLPELLEFLLAQVPLHLMVALICNYVVRQVGRQEAARRSSEARLRAEMEQREQLQLMSRIDGLTGISNRRHLEERLREELERYRRLGVGFTLLFADLDDFKAINDEHGHLFGDDALRLVARSLKESARRIDVVARYGGEEFVVLMPGTTPEGATTFYERIREDLLGRSESEFGFPIRLSAGAVLSDSGSDVAEILKAADEAMYEAKHRGKDRIFIPGVSER